MSCDIGDGYHHKTKLRNQPEVWLTLDQVGYVGAEQVSYRATFASRRHRYRLDLKCNQRYPNTDHAVDALRSSL